MFANSASAYENEMIEIGDLQLGGGYAASLDANTNEYTQGGSLRMMINLTDKRADVFLVGEMGWINGAFIGTLDFEVAIHNGFFGLAVGGRNRARPQSIRGDLINVGIFMQDENGKMRLLAIPAGIFYDRVNNRIMLDTGVMIKHDIKASEDARVFAELEASLIYCGENAVSAQPSFKQRGLGTYASATFGIAVEVFNGIDLTGSINFENTRYRGSETAVDEITVGPEEEFHNQAVTGTLGVGGSW